MFPYKLLIKSLLCVIASLLVAFSLSVPAHAQEDEPESVRTTGEKATLIECYDNQAVKQNQETVSNAEETRKIAKNFLVNALSYNTLSERLRCDPLIVGVLDSNGKATTPSVYSVAQNLVNFGVLLVLLFIAFANILPLKIEAYAIKKAVPLLVFGVLMANLGLPIIRTVVDFSGVITATFIGSTTELGGREEFVKTLIQAVYGGGVQSFGNAMRGLDGGSAGFASFFAVLGFVSAPFIAFGPFFVALIVGAIFLVVFPAIMFLFLGMLLVARIYVLVLLAAVSPVAFASLGFAPLRAKIWTTWWQQFIKWTFMAPATFFLMWLAIRFYEAVGRQTDIGTYAITVTLIYLATQIPMKMGGSIMTNWSKALAQPMRDLAMKPFKAAGEYVQKGFPRDYSRFASNNGLNLVKSVKDFGAEREKFLAEREGRSKSSRLGKTYGRLVNSVKWSKGNWKGQLDEAKRTRYANEEGQTSVRKLVQDLAADTGVNPTDEHETYDRVMSDDPRNAGRKKKFLNTTEEWAKSKDVDKRAAVALLNASLGKLTGDTAVKAVLDGIEKDTGIDTGPLSRMAGTLSAKKNGGRELEAHGGLVLPGLDSTEERAGGDPELFAKLYAQETVSALEKVINAGGEDKAGQARLDVLKNIGKVLGRAEFDLQDLRELQRHPQYQALVKAFVHYKNQIEKEGGDATQAVIYNKRQGEITEKIFEQYEHSFGNASADTFFKSNTKLSPHKPVLESLTKDQDFTSEQREALLPVLENQMEEINNSLRDFLRKTLLENEVNKKQTAEILEKLIRKLPHELRQREVLVRDSGLDDSTQREQIDKIMAALEGYNRVSERINRIMGNQQTAAEKTAKRIIT